MLGLEYAITILKNLGGKNPYFGSIFLLAISLACSILPSLPSIAASSNPNTAVALASMGNKSQPRSGDIKGDFDFYVFSRTWTPEFCKEDDNSSAGCSYYDLQSGIFGELALHGLWPNKILPDDEFQAAVIRYTSPSSPSLNKGLPPMFCPGSALKREDLSTALKLKLAKKGFINFSVIDHEWAKHGSCSTFSSPEEYFQKELDLMDKYPTPQLIKDNYGKTLSYAALTGVYGGENCVTINCTQPEGMPNVQYLESISMLLSKDDFSIRCDVKNKTLNTQECRANVPITIRAPSIDTLLN